ncbi:hypothetical protein BC831DRAFT_455685 [Entophlyctis helioformis]|nr:hypothetical protein BC831DRAFT_455685 [Entophlyctis helioformis]
MPSIQIPFDPPRFNQAEEWIATLIVAFVWPAVFWFLYDAAMHFARARTLFTGTFLILSTVLTLYETTLVICTFFYIHINLLIMRVVLLFVGAYFSQAITMYFLLNLFSQIKLLYRWVPTAYYCVSTTLFLGMFTPRLFYYSLFLSPTEQNWAAKWYSATVFAYTAIANAGCECVCTFAVVSLVRNLNQFNSAHDLSNTDMTTSLATETTGTAQPGDTPHAPSAIRSFLSWIIGKLFPQRRPAQVAVIRLAVYLVLYILHIPGIILSSSFADAAVRPPPSAGWRKAQALTCISGSISVFGVILIWVIIKNLKSLCIRTQIISSTGSDKDNRPSTNQPAARPIKAAASVTDDDPVDVSIQ